jgi:PhnB protein
MSVNPIPEQYPRVTPHLSIAGAVDAIDFYTGGSVIMIGDENWPGGHEPSPMTLGGSPVALFVYVDDVDDVFKRALEAGASSVEKPEDHFYGDRVAMFDDPYGHRWSIGTTSRTSPPGRWNNCMAEVPSTA